MYYSKQAVFEDVLMHAGAMQGQQRANHQYVGRVATKNGWRYFYSQAEMQAYGNAAKKGAQSATNTVKTAAKNTKKAIGDMLNRVASSSQFKSAKRKVDSSVQRAADYVKQKTGYTQSKGYKEQQAKNEAAKNTQRTAMAKQQKRAEGISKWKKNEAELTKKTQNKLSNIRYKQNADRQAAEEYAQRQQAGQKVRDKNAKDSRFRDSEARQYEVARESSKKGADSTRTRNAILSKRSETAKAANERGRQMEEYYKKRNPVAQAQERGKAMDDNYHKQRVKSMKDQAKKDSNERLKNEQRGAQAQKYLDAKAKEKQRQADTYKQQYHQAVSSDMERQKQRDVDSGKKQKNIDAIKRKQERDRNARMDASRIWTQKAINNAKEWTNRKINEAVNPSQGTSLARKTGSAPAYSQSKKNAQKNVKKKQRYYK